jgi:isopentenyl-diphosphate delta-isomerase
MLEDPMIHTATETADAPQVSFDDEPLILVNERDEEIGFRSKAECHEGEGILHRAFSVFAFDAAGRLMIQQRSGEKPLWPLFWSNSCCSHPRRGEELESAVRRRLEEELGLAAEPIYLYKFQYQASFGKAGSEHELCSVWVCRLDGELTINPTEVAAWQFLAPEAVDRELATHPESYTPWFHLEWPRIRQHHWPAVQSLPQ